jgi:hypothetical protein
VLIKTPEPGPEPLNTGIVPRTHAGQLAYGESTPNHLFAAHWPKQTNEPTNKPTVAWFDAIFKRFQGTTSKEDTPQVTDFDAMAYAPEHSLGRPAWFAWINKVN